MVENNSNGKWKVDTAEFQGYVKASLDGIKEDIKETKENIKGFHDEFEKHGIEDRKQFKEINGKIEKQNTKLAKWGGAISVIIIVITFIVQMI